MAEGGKVADDEGSVSDCIEVGWLRPDGYRSLSYKNYPTLSHRAAWMKEVGPIPKGMVIHHICYNRGCSNIEHLDMRTQRQNLLDAGSRSPAKRSADATACPQGHPYDEKNTGRSGGKRYCKTCNAARSSRWAEKNKQRISDYHREYYLAKKNAESQ
jgi:hypothetical protein